MLTPHRRLTGPEQGEQASLKENMSIREHTGEPLSFHKRNRKKITTDLNLPPLTTQELKDFDIPEVQVLIEAFIYGVGTL